MFTYKDSLFQHDTTIVGHHFGEDYLLPTALSVTTLDTLILAHHIYEQKVRVYHYKTFERLDGFGELRPEMRDNFFDVSIPLSRQNNYRWRTCNTHTVGQIYNDTINQRLIRVLRKPYPHGNIYDVELTKADSLNFQRIFGENAFTEIGDTLALEYAAFDRLPYFVQVYDYDFNLLREFDSPVPFNLVGNIGRTYYSYGRYDGQRYWMYKWTWPKAWLER